MSVTYLDTTDAVLHQQQRDGKKGARVMRIVLRMQPREGTSVQDLVNAVAAKLTGVMSAVEFGNHVLLPVNLTHFTRLVAFSKVMTRLLGAPLRVYNGGDANDWDLTPEDRLRELAVAKPEQIDLTDDRILLTRAVVAHVDPPPSKRPCTDNALVLRSVVQAVEQHRVVLTKEESDEWHLLGAQMTPHDLRQLAWLQRGSDDYTRNADLLASRAQLELEDAQAVLGKIERTLEFFVHADSVKTVNFAMRSMPPVDDELILLPLDAVGGASGPNALRDYDSHSDPQFRELAALWRCYCQLHQDVVDASPRW